MKEKHPIDDLFREGLYNSEATPPAAVWERVLAQRSWGHRLLAGLQRRWAISLLLVLLVATPLAWYGIQGGGWQVAAATTSTKVPVDHTVRRAADQGSEGLLPNKAMQPLHEGTPGGDAQDIADFGRGSAAAGPLNNTSVLVQRSGAAAHSSAAEQDNVPSIGEEAHMNSAKGSAPLNAERNPDEKTKDRAEDERSEKAAATTTALQPDVETALAQQLERMGRPDGVALWEYADEDFLLAQPRGIVYPRLLDSMLVGDRPLEAPYVLPNGAWWIGVQFGWNQWHGGWTGTSPLVDEMDKAEEWQSGWQAGVVAGRAWKSGLNLSTGLEVASMKSRFLFNGTSASDSGGYAFVLDTTWQVNATAPDSSYVVYTYSFDLVAVPIGERGVQYSASNRYTLLNIPVELAWQKNVKRFTFSPRIGLNAGFFFGRNGTTLVNGGNVDTGPTAIPANDQRSDDRFGMLLSGSAGVDVGYALNERMQLSVGPGYSTVLTSFGGNELRPAISGFTARARLVYEFGMKQRKARP